MGKTMVDTEKGRVFQVGNARAKSLEVGCWKG